MYEEAGCLSKGVTHIIGSRQGAGDGVPSAAPT
jgi:hypothetical protein